MKFTQAICISIGLFVASQLSFGQSANLFVGVGTAMDSSSNTSVETLGTTYTTPALNGTFVDIGTSILFTPHFGAGADVSWRASKGNYAGLQYRATFYNFDGIWAPISTKHFEPEIHAGIGGMRLGYSYSSTACDQFVGCTTSNEPVESATHFQVHFEAAARIYVTDHVFLRPAVEGHWVNNLFQFGNSVVPEYSLGLGYSLAGNNGTVEKVER